MTWEDPIPPPISPIVLQETVSNGKDYPKSSTPINMSVTSDRDTEISKDLHTEQGQSENTSFVLLVPGHVIAAQGAESSSNSIGRATIGQEGSDISLSPIQTRTAREKKLVVLPIEGLWSFAFPSSNADFIQTPEIM